MAQDNPRHKLAADIDAAARALGALLQTAGEQGIELRRSDVDFLRHRVSGVICQQLLASELEDGK